MKLTRQFMQFLRSEQLSSVLLAVCALIAVMLANSSVRFVIERFWHEKLGFEFGVLSLRLSAEHWVNDGLMTLFFLMIGLEIEREIYVGELSRPRNALLPILAALGGMLVPALIHFAFNAGTPSQRGFGIPMATDIAFALAALSVLGKRVPAALKVFLTALAIIDDLGAIVVIALFYSSNLSWAFLGLVVLMMAVMLTMNRLRVHSLRAYALPGFLMWVFMLQSGVHATLAGVLLAFAIPFDRGHEHSPSNRLLHALHKPVAYIIMPVFALANSGITIATGWLEGLGSSSSLGILLGLVVGKPLGIVMASYLAVKSRLAALPGELGWMHILGAGCIAGIGFTMAIFITLLSTADAQVVQNAKLAIVLASLISGALGATVLSLNGSPKKTSASR